MIFKYNFEIGLENITRNKEITNKALLECLENSSSKHSDTIQNGVTDIVDSGITWVLLDWKLQVLERPKYGEQLTVYTWIRGGNKLFAYRDFELYVNGVLKAIASSKWLLVNKDTLKPIRMTDKLLEKYNPEFDKNVFETNDFEKLNEQEKYDKEIEYKIRKSDIDINNHVHNLNYLDMCTEIIDIQKEFDSVCISYKKEIKYSENVKICMTNNFDTYYIKIFNADTNEVKALVELI